MKIDLRLALRVPVARCAALQATAAALTFDAVVAFVPEPEAALLAPVATITVGSIHRKGARV